MGMRRRAGMRRLSSVWRYGLLLAATLLAIGVLLASLMRDQAQQRAADSARQAAEVVVELAVKPQVDAEQFQRPLDPVQARLLEYALRSLMRSGRIGEVRLWSPAGQPIFSPSGSPGTPEQGELAMLARALRGHPTVVLRDPAGSTRHMAAVLVPVRHRPDGPVTGAAEVLVPYQPIGAAVARDTRLLAAILVALLGLCVLGLRRLAHQARRREHAATHDALTGLPNRTLFRDRTDQAIRLADRELTPAALLLLDLDRFKEVNDTLGHHYGDQLLIQVGQRLPAALRNVDTVARLGGDEFAVLLPRIATAEGAVTVAKKLLAAFEEPFLLEGLSLDVEASIGVAIYPEHANDPDELLQRADIAMYVAKDTHAGFVLFDPRQDQHSPRRLALLGELRRAIEHEQLLLHYQPKVDAHTGQVLGVEALVRWQHPTHGLIPPGEFIPLAERTGLIGALTHYVLDAALHQCRDWRRAGHELSVAVNVSARRLLDLTFPDEVAAALATWEVPARLLVVEITESTIMADPAHALEVLGRLNEMGVQLSIDDFGTGYSSMAYLKSLPVHELKVDRSFVSQMLRSSSDAVIVHSTVDLGRNLGLRVVAEGVEDSLTLEHLDLLGCHAAQGYHISRPVAADDLLVWLDQQAASATAQPAADNTGPTGSSATR
jgi:diguanylate cyclase (GGDEF)-like protein